MRRLPITVVEAARIVPLFPMISNNAVVRRVDYFRLRRHPFPIRALRSHKANR